MCLSDLSCGVFNASSPSHHLTVVCCFCVQNVQSFRLYASFGFSIYTLDTREVAVTASNLSSLANNVGSLFTSEKQKVDSCHASYFCHAFRPCSWRHWHRRLGTKCQHSQSCFRDFQTSIFNNQGQKSSAQLPFCVCLFVCLFKFFLLPSYPQDSLCFFPVAVSRKFLYGDSQSVSWTLSVSKGKVCR